MCISAYTHDRCVYACTHVWAVFLEAQHTSLLFQNQKACVELNILCRLHAFSWEFDGGDEDIWIQQHPKETPVQHQNTCGRNDKQSWTMRVYHVIYTWIHT